MQKIEYDVVIIGAGAAGLFCAARLGQAGQSVLVLDNGKKIGRKILMAGGGFCNFTNLDVTPQYYLSQNPHFVKSALARYTQWDFISLVSEHGIAYHEKELGQLFCDHSSQQIVDLLLKECQKGQVEIQLRQQVDAVERLENADDSKVRFRLQSNGNDLLCHHLVIATGGLSMPALGATAFGYKLAEQFGLKVVAPRASLVPFTWREQDKVYAQLAGVSLAVNVAAQSGKQFHNQMLFTHRGLSGPAMLQISNYWQPNQTLTIDLLPEQQIGDYLQQLRQTSPKMQLKTALGRILPKRLVELWLELKLFDDQAIAQLSKLRLQQLEQLIHRWQFDPNGTEGYRTAEVTMGGVDTAAISSKTMQAHDIPGLYFIGEVLDVTGWLGGYNFQWAWSSAYVCAEAIAA
ncbi:NAD(P)/FAD-dependent oxidoreductase [Testudinibacter sp. TR-2022]|uniref:NAD(P)/FAD-dependent oxidoreductase n=1 Tax=Testudinibacter sp. TR-2022 TaxID=2585029 RepID=UPI00111AB36E|nr:NAD(P)/FAD-dependent oxidoreductase [Testudinibacter sp. TR-2022]TNH04340.1 NAD(P)/FAD-dependent oxidoreductase [Pasteurellaceae bacterium Phil31]TNH10887.1 NAD(P)/FAD-dependent oxidoreductase [Testudinibacter sp. TR-2022]TNH11057.1 NAD(P)/FAD-dependent oxidoreductase [Testudinibacter sp. TR-2022]TNH12337.1 NAD(P)/FAD-dependent oxidoreductase [Testudinibacter sp. TR-2022]TNH19096.1 NAD(P)/FAD-dependent oxidoreductase [Testudinibacter sp. TR-2022]